MIYKEDNINIDYDGYGLASPVKKATVTSYIIDQKNDCYLGRLRPAVIICPGGAYSGRAYHEGEPIALTFNSVGFHAFVLNYSVAPMRFPGSLLELSKVIATVRACSQKYNIDPNKIIVCGFSAGGHLAASVGVYWKEAFIQRFLGYDNNENKPNGLILCYPVISNKHGVANIGSIQNLLGKYPDEKELALFSLEDNVTDLVPPTFIWHCNDDVVVPPENSLFFTAALRTHNVPVELHLFPNGGHGIGLANEVTAAFPGQIVPACQNWIDMAIRFIEKSI